MDLARSGKLRKVKDEPRISPDGDVYRATEWQHESGAKVEINIDIEPVRYHARVDGKHTAVNQDERGLMAFISRLFGL
jgi:hypothetical protein